MIFSTLQLFHRDRASRVAIEHLLIAVAKTWKSKIISVFGRGLQRHCNSMTKSGGPGATHPHWIMFRWTCCVILGAGEEFVKSDQLPSYASAQLQLLGAMAASPNRHTVPTGVAIFNRALLNVKGLAEAYNTVLFGMDTPDASVSFLAGGLVHYFAVQKTLDTLKVRSFLCLNFRLFLLCILTFVFDSVQAAFIQVFVKCLFGGAKSSITSLHVAAWRTLLQSLTTSEFETVYVPVAFCLLMLTTLVVRMLMLTTLVVRMYVCVHVLCVYVCIDHACCTTHAPSLSRDSRCRSCVGSFTSQH